MLRIDDQSLPLSLAELRKRSGWSQADLADKLGTTQSGVSRIERQDDTKISTLLEYVAHLGGRLRLVVEHPDGDTELAVSASTPSQPKEPRAFRVVWQNPKTRGLSLVGRLRFTGSEFTFQYEPNMETLEGFKPFEEFPDVGEAYASPELFDFFRKRLPQAADSSFSMVLEALGLSRREATPVELLAHPISESSDPIQILPDLEETAEGSLTGTFLASGVRYADAESKGIASEMIGRLSPGELLDVQAEPTNPANPRALKLVADGVRLAYVPNHLLDDIALFESEGRRLDFSVERANGPDIDWHLRLLVRVTASTPADD